MGMMADITTTGNFKLDTGVSKEASQNTSRE
jgi:hypothetical protein